MNLRSTYAVKRYTKQVLRTHITNSLTLTTLEKLAITSEDVKTEMENGPNEGPTRTVKILMRTSLGDPVPDPIPDPVLNPVLDPVPKFKPPYHVQIFNIKDVECIQAKHDSIMSTIYKIRLPQNPNNPIYPVQTQSFPQKVQRYKDKEPNHSGLDMIVHILGK